LIDHAKVDGLDNLITLVGVRVTTGRCEAAEAVDMAFGKLGRKAPACRTHVTPLRGGEMDDFEQTVQQATASGRGTLSPEVMRSLVHHYGTKFDEVLAVVRQEPAMAASIGHSPTIRAQVVHAVRHEMAQTLGDVIFRRTDLATGEYPGRAALEQCTEVMQTLLRWDPVRVRKEIDQVISRFPARWVRRVDRDGPSHLTVTPDLAHPPQPRT
jgi:glycerol-3-phosphate dehydrogenase